MKKFGIMLMICTLLSSNMSVLAFNDVEDSPYKAEIEFFKTEEIVNGKEPGKFYPDDELTRAETAKICAGLMPGTYFDESEVIFADVLLDHWAVKEIRAVSLTIDSLTPEYDGWFSENPAERLFYPEKAVTTEYLLDVCLSLLGYKQKDNDPDIGYENTYEKALKCGLLEGIDITPEKYVTRGEAMKIFYNTINSPVVVTHGLVYDEEKNKYTTNATVMDGSSEDAPLTTLWMYLNER